MYKLEMVSEIYTKRLERFISHTDTLLKGKMVELITDPIQMQLTEMKADDKNYANSWQLIRFALSRG